MPPYGKIECFENISLIIYTKS